MSVCSMDNSEWMRNGDQFPTRLDAQHDAGTPDYCYCLYMNIYT